MLADYPEPKTGALIYCDPDAFLVDCPLEGRFQRAAELRRFARYGGRYEAIDKAMPVEKRFNAETLPVSYGLSETRACFLDLLQRHMKFTTQESFLLGARPGLYGQTIGGVTIPDKPDKVSPRWNRREEEKAIIQGMLPQLQFGTAGEGGFTSTTITRPIQVGTFHNSEGTPYTAQWPAETVSITCKLGGLPDGIGTIESGILILLWGKCYCPTALSTTARHEWQSFPPYYGLEEFAAWIEVTCGRAVMQMLHVREAIMEADLGNIGTGGRGGTVWKKDRPKGAGGGKKPPKGKNPKPTPKPKKQ